MPSAPSTAMNVPRRRWHGPPPLRRRNWPGWKRPVRPLPPSWTPSIRTVWRLWARKNALLFHIHQMMLEDPDFCGGAEDRHPHRKGLRGLRCAGDRPGAGRRLRRHGGPLSPGPLGRRAGCSRAARPHPHRSAGGPSAPDSPAILAADDLVPSETARLDRSMVLALVTAGGSLNSHTAIFARTMGLPAVTGIGAEALEQMTSGLSAGVDGSAGTVLLDPDETARAGSASPAGRRAGGFGRTGALPGPSIGDILGPAGGAVRQCGRPRGHRYRPGWGCRGHRPVPQRISLPPAQRLSRRGDPVRRLPPCAGADGRPPGGHPHAGYRRGQQATISSFHRKRTRPWACGPSGSV